MRLNQTRRAKKKLPKRVKQQLFVQQLPSQVRSACFMKDTIYAGKPLRTFNVIDDFNREGFLGKIDT